MVKFNQPHKHLSWGSFDDPPWYFLEQPIFREPADEGRVKCVVGVGWVVLLANGLTLMLRMALWQPATGTVNHSYYINAFLHFVDLLLYCTVILYFCLTSLSMSKPVLTYWAWHVGPDSTRQLLALIIVDSSCFSLKTFHVQRLNVKVPKWIKTELMCLALFGHAASLSHWSLQKVEVDSCGASCRIESYTGTFPEDSESTCREETCTLDHRGICRCAQRDFGARRSQFYGWDCNLRQVQTMAARLQSFGYDAQCQGYCQPFHV